MTTFISLRFSNGTVGRMQFYEDPTPETIQAAIDKTIFSQGAVVSWRVVRPNDFPLHNEYREAWRDNGATVEVDMPMARVIHMNYIRNKRQQKFETMGFPFRLDPSVETAIVPLATRTELQRLRDIPQTFDLSVAETPEELKILWPQNL